MAIYAPFTWANEERGQTPITAERLNAIEKGIEAASTDANKALTESAQGGISVSPAAPAGKLPGHLWVNSSDTEFHRLFVRNGQTTGDVYVPAAPLPVQANRQAENVPANSGVIDFPGGEISHGTVAYPVQLYGTVSFAYGASTAEHQCDLDVTDAAGSSIIVGPRTAGFPHITVTVPFGSAFYDFATVHIRKDFDANVPINFKVRYNNGGGNAYLRATSTSWAFPR